ncbi:porin family protein [Marinilabiliaceae bacterium ANBcel2]|nr:porin family protein [Marinilabiliaceae bacterium ANBcel2]
MKFLTLFFLLFFLNLQLAETFGQQVVKRYNVPNLPHFDYQRINFGFLIGFNTMDFRVDHKDPELIEGDVRYADIVTLNPGITIGMVSSFRIAERLNMRLLPGISFGQRDLLYISEDGEKDRRALELKSTFIECPFILKYGGKRMTNVRPFLITGINPRYDLAKGREDGLDLKAFDLYWEIGAGMDFYMTYFRLSTELKLSVGLSNILNRSGTGEPEDILYTDVLDRLTSRLFVFSFYFE